MTATVTKLPTKTKTVRKVSKPEGERKPSAHTIKRDKAARLASFAPYGVWAGVLALSLSHQAHGVLSCASIDTWEGWTTAIAIDCGYLCAKILPTFGRNDGECAKLHRWLNPISWCCLALCVMFNAFGYMHFEPVAWLKMAVDGVLAAYVPAIMLTMYKAGSILRFGK